MTLTLVTYSSNTVFLTTALSATLLNLLKSVLSLSMSILFAF